MSREISKLVVARISANPGITRENLLETFPEADRRSANTSIGRFLGEGSGRLVEIDGGLYLDEEAPESEEVPIPVATGPRSLFDVVPVHELPVQLPESLKASRLSLMFRFVLRIENVKRIGMSNVTNPSSADIAWYPPGSEVLEVNMGDAEDLEDLANVALIPQNRYLVTDVVTSQGGRRRFYQAPAGCAFMVRWTK